MPKSPVSQTEGVSPWSCHPSDIPAMRPSDKPRLVQALAQVFGWKTASLGPVQSREALSVDDSASSYLPK
jgi:1,2-phenylacetyl-CoA epoxidase PaaB subunit